jgi:hypothetical protein
MENLIDKAYNLFFEDESFNNQMYGHNVIMRKYARVRLPYLIPGQLQHGWHIDHGIHGDLQNITETEKLKKYFVWNKNNLTNAHKYGFNNVIAIGAPFIYLPEIKIDVETKSNSVLLFPVHSCESEGFVDPITTFKRYLADIDFLHNEFESITACLYWREYENDSIRKLFEKNDINAVTLGHRDNNPNFLFSFCKHAYEHEFISSNIFSTAIFYGLYLKKKTFILGSARSEEWNYKQWEGRKLYDSGVFEDQYHEILWEHFDQKSHSWIGNKELGLEFKKSPEDICKLFNWNPIAYFKRNVPYTGRKIAKFLG